MGYVLCIGTCCFCKGIFGFNPLKVPSVKVDGNGDPDPNGDKAPICENCMERGNAMRRSKGLEPFPILPGAYEAVNENDL